MIQPHPPYEVIIREGDLDSFAHMNNAAYLVLFEDARWEFITRHGYGHAEVLAFQKGPVLLEMNLRFKQEIKLREKIKITTTLISHERKISKFKQEMVKENGILAAEMNLTLGFFDLQTRRLIDPTIEWKKAIGLNA